MNVNERIRYARKEAGLSQKELATRIGMSQNAISWSEQPGNNVPDSTIKSISTALEISPLWLSKGEGPMKVQKSSFSLDSFIEEHGGTDLEIEIVKTYFELEPEIRHTILEHFKKKFISESQDTSPAAPLPTVEEAEANYIKNVLHSAQSTDSAISSSTEDVKKVSGE